MMKSFHKPKTWFVSFGILYFSINIPGSCIYTWQHQPCDVIKCWLIWFWLGWLVWLVRLGWAAHGSQKGNPDSISDKNIWFSIPFFRPDPKKKQSLITLSNPMTFCRGLFSYLFWRSMSLFQSKKAKSITLFQTKTAPKPYPLWRHTPIYM